MLPHSTHRPSREGDAISVTYRIRDWDAHFENAASRKLKRLDWVAVPNKMDGSGYMALVNHPEGAAHLGAWYAAVEIASRQKVRGTLPDVGGICQCLGKISQLPAAVFESALPRLVQIGWIEQYNQQVTESATSLGFSPNVVADSPANLPALWEKNGPTGKGREWNGTEGQAGLPALMLENLRKAQAWAVADCAFSEELPTVDFAARVLLAAGIRTEGQLEAFAHFIRRRFEAGRVPGAARGPTSMGLFINWAEDFAAQLERTA